KTAYEIFTSLEFRRVLFRSMPAGYINFTTKLVIVLAGLLFMVAAYFGNYQKLARWSWWLYAITIAVMYYSLLFGTQINGLKQWIDRKSTRLNSSHVKISYAV